MRASKTQSRTISRAKSPAPSLLSKSMKLPLIANGGVGGIDENAQSSMWSNSLKSNGYSIGVCSQQGKRPYQEDEYSIRPFLNAAKPGSELPETHFFGLFDGHAGGKCSQHVAANLANALLEDEAFVTNLPQAIKRTYYMVNEQFLKVAEKLKLHDGSTGICAMIRDNKILVANAGDCRCVLISNGRPIQLSNDHKPTSPDEQKRINALGGQVVYCMGVARVNRVLAVSRAFGNRTLRTVIRPDAEMMQRELVDGDDFLVLASDGLWDVLKNKDVCDVCYSPFLQRKPQAIADELVQLALTRGSMDNVTCIVVNLADLRNKSMVLKEDPFSLMQNRPAGTVANFDGAEPLFHKSKDISEINSLMNSTPNKHPTKNGSIENNPNNSILLNNEDDDNATQVDIASAINAQHQALRKLNTGNNVPYPKYIPNNNMTTHEAPSRQLSVGNFHNSDNESNDVPHLTSSGNMGFRKQLMNSSSKTPLLKATSTSSINTANEAFLNAASLPNVNPSITTENNRLFTTTDPMRLNTTTPKAMSRGMNSAEAVAHKASFPTNNSRSRNSTGLTEGSDLSVYNE